MLYLIPLALWLLQPMGDSRATPTIDQLPLPSGAVIVVAGDLKQALNLAGPGAIVLSAQRYQALMDQAARGEKAALPGAQMSNESIVLSVCRISGKVTISETNREVLDLQISLEFRTLAPNVLVPIGLRGLRLDKALLDGETPVWGPDRNVLTVQVKEPRVYNLVLHGQATVARSAVRESIAHLEHKVVIERFPAAAITTLDITVPDRVHSAVVKGAGPLRLVSSDSKVVSSEPLSSQQPALSTQMQSDALGVLEQLELSWQTSGSRDPARDESGSAAAVTGDLRVTLAEGVVDTDVRLRVLPGLGRDPIKELRLKVAPGTDVLRAEEELRGDVLSWNMDGPAVTVHLKQPVAAGDPALQLRLRLQNKYTAKPGAAISVAQCQLLEPKASSQVGTIAVFVAPEIHDSGAHVRWRHADMHRADPRDLSAAENRNADLAFRYWQQPVKLEAVLEITPALPPVVELRASHVFRFTGAILTLSSEFEILRINRGGVSEFDFQWPKDWGAVTGRLASGGAEFDYNPNTAMMHVRFATRPVAPFKIKLEGALGIESQNSARMVLPTVALAVSDRADKKTAAELVLREGEVRIVPEVLEVWLRQETGGLLTEGNRLPEPELPLTGPLKLVLSPELRMSPVLALSWQLRPLQSDIRAEVYLTAREMHVEQALRFQFSPGAPGPPRIGFRLPPDLGDSYQLRLSYGRADGSTETRGVATSDILHPLGGEKAIAVPRDARGSCTLNLVYRKFVGGGGVTGEQSPHTTKAAMLAIPLLQPAGADSGQSHTEVRFWTSLGLQVHSSTSGWRTVAATPVAGSDLLPTLELHADTASAPLTVTCEAIGGHSGSPEKLYPMAIADRVLVEVQSPAEEACFYRVRFWFSRIRSETLSIALPGTSGGTGPVLDKVFFNQVELSHLSLSEKQGVDDGTRLQIPIPARTLAQPAQLELRYHTTARSLPSALITVLNPPLLDERVLVRDVRWRVEWPPGWVPLGLSSTQSAEQAWQWLVGLWPPVPAPLQGEIQQWFEGRNDGGMGKSERRSAWSAGSSISSQNSYQERPALSFAQIGRLTPLRLQHAPRQMWLLGWSLAILLGGLALYCFPPRWPWLWLWAAACVVAGMVLGVLEPQWLAGIVFAMQPGAVVLSAALVILWLRNRRWRRQVTLLPAFTRVKTGSSLIRSGSASELSVNR